MNAFYHVADFVFEIYHVITLFKWKMQSGHLIYGISPYAYPCIQNLAPRVYVYILHTFNFIITNLCCKAQTLKCKRLLFALLKDNRDSDIAVVDRSNGVGIQEWRLTCLGKSHFHSLQETTGLGLYVIFMHLI